MLFIKGALAQITVKYDTYRDALKGVRSTYYALNARGSKFYLGEKREQNNRYDFTCYYYGTPVVDKFIDPVATPYKAYYGLATHCHVDTVFGTKDIQYTYFQLRQDGFYRLGLIAIKKGKRINIKENPPIPLIKLPLSLESAWEYKAVTKQDRKHPDAIIRVIYKAEIIAAGTLKTHLWIKPCLVSKCERIQYDKSKNSTDTSKSVWYEFVTKAGVSAMITVDDVYSGSNSPIIRSASYINISQ